MLRRIGEIIIATSELSTRWMMWICVGSIIIMMFLTAFDVCGRYFFNSPIRGALEITEFLMVMTVAAGFAYTQKVKGHISVELFAAWLPLKYRKVIYGFGYVICLILYLLITWQCVKGGLVQWRNSITSGAVNLPLWPFYFFLSLGTCVLCFVFFADILTLFHGKDGDL